MGVTTVSSTAPILSLLSGSEDDGEQVGACDGPLEEERGCRGGATGGGFPAPPAGENLRTARPQAWGAREGEGQ